MALFHNGLFAVVLVFASPAAMSMQTFLEPKAQASPQHTKLTERTGLEGKRLLAGVDEVSTEKAKADEFNAALAFKREKAAADEAKFVATYKRANAQSGNEYHAGGHRDFKEVPPQGFSQREWAEWKQNLYTGDVPQHIQQVYFKEDTSGTEAVDFIPATQGWAEAPRVMPWVGHAHDQEDDVSGNENDMDIRR